MLAIRRAFRRKRALVLLVMTAAAPHMLVRARAQTAAPPLMWAGIPALQEALFEQAARQGLKYLPNQVLVKFRSGVTSAGQQRALSVLASRPGVGDITWSGPLGVITDMSQPNADVLAAQLRAQPEVEYAQPNYLSHPQMVPSDPDYASRQWNFAALDLPHAWDVNAGASGVTIAVVDTGVTNFSGGVNAPTWDGTKIVTYQPQFAINPDLGAGRLVSPRDFITSFGAIVLDTDSHGTHVSGTLGEDTNNGVMLAGIAYNARIMPVKACASYWDVQFSRSASGIPGFAPLSAGGCPDSSTSAGLRYAADNGASVINYSIGSTAPSAAVQDAINYAVTHGAFVAIAAGNDFDGGNPVQYPASYASSIDGAMAVGAVGPSLTHAYYSSSGSYVEIAAPGGDQHVGGSAGGVWQSTLRQSDTDPNILTLIFPRFDRYDERSLQGTSMATPHVAGIAALIYSQLGSAATPSLVEQIIKKTARACTQTSCDASATGTRGRNDFFGAGLIQPRTALFGFGIRR